MSLITIFIILQHGLFLENLSLPNITIKKIYIKWNEQLNISIEEIDIKKSANSDTRADINDISKYIGLSARLFSISESINIEKLYYDKLKLSLQYNQKTKGILQANSPFFNLNANFLFQKDVLLFDIDKLTTLQKRVLIDGKIIIDPKQKKLFSKLHCLINNDANLTLYAISNTNRLDYRVISHNKIQHIQELVSLFNLPQGIRFWAMDAIDAPSAKLNSCQGFIQYNDLSSAYRHISLSVTLNKLNYTYNPDLDTIHTQTTDLEFKHGMLFIYPREAYSYGMYLNKSWLKIDFTKPQEILTLHLLFDGMLNKDMLHILSAYKIDLPFLQHSGAINTNLTLKVNLRTIAIDAKGDFYTKKANFDYLGLNLDIADTEIKLHNYDVDITQMKAKYKKMATADVTVKYNAKNAIGNINFIFNTIRISPDQHLDTKEKPLAVSYKISPSGDTISVAKSHWILNNLHATLDPLTMPFNLKTLNIMIPTSYFSVEKISDGFVTGSVNIKKSSANLVIDLLHLNYQGIKLSQSNTELELHYNKQLSLKSKNDIFLSVNGSQYRVKDLALLFNKNNILLNNTSLYISQYINTKISAKYNLQKKKATIELKNFILTNPKNKKILYYKTNTNLLLSKQNNIITIESKELDANFIIDPNKWILNLNSIATIAKNSNLLKHYDITNGKVIFYKNSNEKYTKFKGELHYKYKLLTEQNKPVTLYKINGYVTKKQSVYLQINKKVNLKIADNIKINMHDYGINLDELLKFVDLLTKENKKEKQASTDIFFKAKNSYLYFGNKRFALADFMNLQYYKDMITAQLTYKKGKAGFKLQGDKFHLYGNNFNDHFMENLFSLSRFKGGSLDFSMSGKLKDYSGTFYVKNTTIQDYVILNNILAFINTIPSLATFSLPGYSKDGLDVKNAYMKFHAKDHIFHISDIYVGSKEIKILGKGRASVKYNNIDLTLNLKTDLGSNLSKIPLVGYIIFDGESISTTLKITGKLTDPKVETMLARDIAVAPLNIILRTLTLPYKLIKDIADINSSK